ncbi:MAG: hypothetical protein JOY78_10935, partial [Pseudonocardia sp.]|nr:hypothetical protein [Pseudonocardia sp.]
MSPRWTFALPIAEPAGAAWQEKGPVIVSHAAGRKQHVAEPEPDPTSTKLNRLRVARRDQTYDHAVEVMVSPLRNEPDVIVGRTHHSASVLLISIVSRLAGNGETDVVLSIQRPATDATRVPSLTDFPPGIRPSASISDTDKNA